MQTQSIPMAVRQLSTAQAAFWEKRITASDAAGITVGLSIDIFAEVAPERLRAAAQALLDQSDALRTSFTSNDGLMSQIVMRRVVQPFQWLDLSGPDESDETRARVVDAWANVPFDLSVAPLIDHLLIRVAPGHWTWHCRGHHLIVDAGGAAIGIAAILQGYAALAVGGLPDMSHLGSYMEHLQADGAYVVSDRYREDLAYWIARHATRAAPIFSRGEGTAQPVVPRQHTIDRQRYDALIEACRAAGIQPFHAFVAALGALSYRLFGRTSVCLGLATHNRVSELERRTVGLFAGTMAFRLDVDPNESLVNLAQRASKHLRRDYRHARLPLSHLVTSLGASRAPLYDLALSFQPASYEMDLNGAAVRLRSGLFAGMDTEPVAIHIRDPQGDSPLGVDLTHRPDLVASAAVVRMYESFIQLLCNWPRVSAQPVAGLALGAVL